MLRKFLYLQWKQFRRSSYFEAALAIKIFMLIGIIYFGGIAVFLGGAGYFLLKKVFPDVDPMLSLNKLLIYWWLFDLLLRYFIQQVPVLNIKPLMIIPVKRKQVVKFVLGKTSLSFFNILPLLFFVPFSLVLIFHHYHPLYVMSWFIGILGLIYFNNYAIFLINKTKTYG